MVGSNDKIRNVNLSNTRKAKLVRQSGSRNLLAQPNNENANINYSKGSRSYGPEIVYYHKSTGSWWGGRKSRKSRKNRRTIIN